MKKQLIEKELTDAEIQKEFSKLNDELAFKDHEIETLVHQQPSTTKKESKKDSNNNNNHKDIHNNQEELQQSNNNNKHQQQKATMTRTKSPGKIDNSKTIKLPSGG